MKKIRPGRLSDFKHAAFRAAGKGSQLTENKTRKVKHRYALLDSLRGLALINMIIYHGVWNMVYIYGFDWDWYRGKEAYLWQQSICWTFILLSGFCWSMGKRQLKNGLLVFGGGLLVTAVTLLVMPSNRVISGVLTCIGSCILLLIPLDRFLRKLPPAWGGIASFFLFLLTQGVNGGYLGIGGIRLMELPEGWYQGVLGIWLGFPHHGFYSTDYFSILPWFFLFLTGYFLYQLCQERGWLQKKVLGVRVWGLEILGRNSLLIYLLHQPILYLVGNIVWA